ncbi:hypothetical protein IWX90DRAFT_434171 [Phyllosticta citrichinensis]|uniref:Uncharacterized protein n=1 Tax=Phyllosticta citrichinensis TaxID=1130410 RepID=A0ABR1XUG0_9PEZI
MCCPALPCPALPWAGLGWAELACSYFAARPSRVESRRHASKQVPVHAGLGRTKRSCLTRKQTAADASFSLSAPMCICVAPFLPARVTADAEKIHHALAFFSSSSSSSPFISPTRPLFGPPPAAAAPLQKNQDLPWEPTAVQCSPGQRPPGRPASQPAKRRRTQQPADMKARKRKPAPGFECPKSIHHAYPILPPVIALRAMSWPPRLVLFSHSLQSSAVALQFSCLE